PATLSGRFQGTAQAFESSLKGLGLLLLVAVLVIYLVLGILYESFIHPLTILSGLPAAGAGALLTLLLFHAEPTVYASVGIVMLTGIVKKNATMLLDSALEAELPVNSAVAASGPVRPRAAQGRGGAGGVRIGRAPGARLSAVTMSGDPTGVAEPWR